VGEVIEAIGVGIGAEEEIVDEGGEVLRGTAEDRGGGEEEQLLGRGSIVGGGWGEGVEVEGGAVDWIGDCEGWCGGQDLVYFPGVADGGFVGGEGTIHD